MDPSVSAVAGPAVTDGEPARLPRYRFVALGVVWSAYLIVFLSRLCVGPLSPFLKASFHLSNAQIGGLTSATAVTYAPTLIFASWLADRIGVRRGLIIGTVITGVCIGAVAFAPSYPVMLVLLACSGFGCGFIFPTAVKSIMVWFPPRERATAVGANQAAVNVSGMLGAAVMPALAIAFSWRAGFLFAAVLAFVVCAVAVAFYRDPRPGESPAELKGAGWGSGAAARVLIGEPEQGLPAVTGDEAADRAAVRPGFLALLRSRDILLLGLSALFLCMIEFAALSQLVLFLNTTWAYTVTAAAGLLAFTQAAGAIGKPLIGLVSDRLLGRRRKPALLALAGLAGLSSAIFALAGPGRPWLLWVALFLLGIGAVGWGGLFSTLAGETAGPEAAGAAAGVAGALENIGIFIGPALFGYIVDRSGSYTPAWWAMVVAAGCAVALLAPVRERRHA